MKKIIWIMLAMLLMIAVLTSAYIDNSSNYDSLFYFGSGGNVESTATKDVGTGIGQTVIGEISELTYNYTIQYGIFYVNITFVPPPALYLPIGIYIEDFGIEWVKLNWTI